MKKINLLLLIISIIIFLTGLGFIIIPKGYIEEGKDSVYSDKIEIIESDNSSYIENEDPITIPSKTKEEINEVITQTTENNEDLSTTETIESNQEEEELISDEGALEVDGVVEQENISYDGDYSGSGLSLLGAYQGLTYYSQADSRWANIMYSSIGDNNQTMKSSACGPTSAAMIVSSSKGTILPTTMASIAVANNYRTANNGTAWSFYSFVADYFNINEFYTTSDFYTMLNYLKQKNSDGSSKYYVIASCGSGLFTTGGHYIVLTSSSDGIITVYDPYLYTGKFNTASRRAAAAVISGNSVYVTESSFKKYSNYKNFWIYSNDQGNGNPNLSATVTIVEDKKVTTTPVSYTRYVSTSGSALNVRKGAGTQYNIISTLPKGTQVNVVELYGGWSRINSPKVGWVSSSYLSSAKVISQQSLSYQVKIVANSLNIRKSYSTSSKKVGSYNKGKIVTILETHNGWGRTSLGWISLNYTSKSTNDTIVKYNTIINKTYTLKNKTTLYSKGTLTGNKYNYLGGTKIKVISHYNNFIDYVYIPKTKRYAYCKTINFK